jgi:hypothetical protein
MADHLICRSKRFVSSEDIPVQADIVVLLPKVQRGNPAFMKRVRLWSLHAISPNPRIPGVSPRPMSIGGHEYGHPRENKEPIQGPT